MPRDIRPSRAQTRPNSATEAEARVRERFRSGGLIQPDEDDLATFTPDDWVALDTGRKLQSTRFGQLDDVEENRLAAKAADEMGWPTNIMSGATKNRSAWSSCGLTIRQMSEIKYDGRKPRSYASIDHVDGANEDT